MLALVAALGLVMGIVTGGLGGGGGVLTVPALVYLLGQSAQDATAGSVVIVGITAAVGAITRIRSRGVDWRKGLALGVAGIPAAYLGALLNHRVSQSALLLVFAALTITAAAAMLLDNRSSRRSRDDDPDETRIAGPTGRGSGATGTAVGARRGLCGAVVVQVVLCGAAVGFLTGFLGVGGGFIVVPALVIVLRMPMTLAVGTSLLVIVVNSVSSVASRLGVVHLDWSVIAPFTVAAVIGAVLGKRVAGALSGDALTRTFAVLLIAVGAFVGIQSLISL